MRKMPGLVFAVLLCLPSTGLAQSEGFYINIDFIKASIRGADTKIGDSVVYAAKKKDITVLSGAEYKPVMLELPGQKLMAWDAGYSGKNFSFKIRHWNFSSGASLRGVKESRYEDGSRIIGMIRMWDYTSIPLTNTLEQSRYSPVSYGGTESLSLSRTDFVIGKSIGPANVSIGASLVNLKNSQTLFQEQEGFYFEYFHPYLYHLRTKAFTQSNGKSGASFKGIQAGIGGEAKLNFLVIDWNANQAFLFGNVKRKADWADYYSAEAISGFPPNQTVLYQYYKETINFDFENGEKIMVPVTEIRTKISTKIKKVNLGAGFFASYWSGVPVSPSWSMPIDWGSALSSSWQLPRKNITISGMFYSVGLTF